MSNTADYEDLYYKIEDLKDKIQELRDYIDRHINRLEDDMCSRLRTIEERLDDLES